MKTMILLAVAGLSMCGAAFGHEGAPKMDMMKMADTNNDGKISLAEHNAYSAMVFSKMDANRDGSVTAAEMEAGHKMMMKDHDMKDHKMKADGMREKPASRP